MGDELAGSNGHGNDAVGPTQPFFASVDTRSPHAGPNPTEPGPTLPSASAQPPGWQALGAYPADGAPATASDIATLLASAAKSLEDLSREFPGSVPVGHGPSRWLRKLVGIDETLLARVWEERPRYTGLGAIVLGTAMMAAFSVFDALNQAIGPVWPVLIPVALFWGTFICCIDRWLISSTHGVRTARWRIFLPRLMLSLLFGVIIATPLVLTIFGSEVVTRAATDQQNELTSYESQLKACNPLPDPTTGKVPAVPATCAGQTLPVPNPATGLTQALAREEAQQGQLAKTVGHDNAVIQQYDMTVRDECTGVSGPGLTGQAGAGPNCERDRRQENAFEQQNDVGTAQRQLTALNAEIQQQTATIGAQVQAYSNDITNAINDKITAREHSQGRIGFLDRINALGELFRGNVAIAAATVLLGLFVLVVDCLPVLSKMMSGNTNYDRLVDSRLRSAEATTAAAIRLSERRSISADEVALHAVESQKRARLEQIDEASRVDKGRRDAEVNRKIAELTEELRRVGS
jgi:hypothetical protein